MVLMTNCSRISNFPAFLAIFGIIALEKKGQTGGAVLYLLASSDGALYIINLIIAAPRNSLQLSVKKDHCGLNLPTLL